LNPQVFFCQPIREPPHSCSHSSFESETIGEEKAKRKEIKEKKEKGSRTPQYTKLLSVTFFEKGESKERILRAVVTFLQRGFLSQFWKPFQDSSGFLDFPPTILT